MDSKQYQHTALKTREGQELALPVFDLIWDQSDNDNLIKKLHNNGIKTFSGRTNFYFYGSAEEKSIAEIIKKYSHIATLAPEARLMLSITLKPSHEWRIAHPDDVFISSGGEYSKQPHLFEGHAQFTGIDDPEWQRTAEPSVFSKIENSAMASAIGNLLTALKKESYYSRIDGVFIGCYVHGEWAVPHWYPDASNAGKAGFKSFLKERYKTVEKLREVWSQDNASFDDFEMPMRQSMYHRLNFNMLQPDPQPLRDYIQAEAFAVGGKFHHCCEAVKQHDPKLFAGGFFGYGHPYQSELRHFLQDDAIDFVCTPMEYINRQPGGGVSTQSPYEDMPQVHGKIFFDELDTRTHLATIHANNVGRPRNARESLDVLWRDTATMLIRNHAGWYLDFAGYSVSSDLVPGVQESAQLTRDHDSFHNSPEILDFHKQFRNLYAHKSEFDLTQIEDVKIFTSRMNNQMTYTPAMSIRRVEFPMAGLPYLSYELDDLLGGYVSPGKLNILEWPVMLDQEQMTRLQQFLATSPHHWLIHGSAGLLDSSRTSVPVIDRMERLTGFKLDMEWFKDEQCLEAVPCGSLADSPLLDIPTVGQSHKPLFSRNVPYELGKQDFQTDPLPPIACPLRYRISVRAAPECEILATYKDNGSGAVAMRKNSAGGSVALFLPAVLNSCMIRVFADWADAHLYVEEDCYLTASRGMVLLHQARDGEYAVHLPDTPLTIRDIRNDKILHAHEGMLRLKGPKATTHLLELRYV